MSEITYMWIAVAKVVGVLICATLYSLGGRNDIPKWVRRYLSSFVLTCLVVAFSIYNNSFSYYYLLVYPLLIGAYSLGYGSTSTLQKILKRLLCGIAITCAGLPIVIITGAWWLFGLQAILAISASTTLGLTQSLQAAQEELMICLLATILVPFYV